ncbi:MAG: alpha-amylase family glycosyl hydrolase [Chloroflexota bacterium]
MFRISSGKIRALMALTVLSLMVQAPVSAQQATPKPAAPKASPVGASANTPDPSSVTIAGSLQSEMGCGGDWNPACATSHLTYDVGDDVWQGTWALPAGGYEYKAALNDSWDENYGLHAQPNGPNIPLNLAAGSPVKFYYDHKSHWITDNKGSVIATAAGSFQSELGCPGDWQPDCLRSWLEDPSGSGTYGFDTSALPQGNYEAKVTINESWDENYGQGGSPGGANIPFTVPFNYALVSFRYNQGTHILTVTSGHSHDNNVEYAGLGHNSQDLIYRQPFGAVNPNTPITLRFRTFHDDVTGVRARFYDTATSTQTFQDLQLAAAGVSCYDVALTTDTCDFWQTSYTPTQLSTLYYRFTVTDGTATAYYADDNFKDGGWGVATNNLIDNSYSITVFDPAFQPISWMKDAVIYQIFPDRFRNGRSNNDPSGNEPRYSFPPNPLDKILKMAWSALPEGYCSHYVNPATPCTQLPRGRDYFGGDLKGVDQGLGYLQAQGINTIYLNPIFDAGSNHAYDTQNYFQIDPFFGTQKDWENLNKHAEQLGMRIVLDGVFNHVSSDSPYFDRYHHYTTVGACESVNSPYRSWFYFTAQAGGPCAGPSGPNTMNYTGWFGFDSIPVLNKDIQGVRNLIYAQGNSSVAPYWLKQGADGWRLDVMGDGSFPADFWTQFRTAVKSVNPNAPIIGELWKKDEILPKIHGDQADTTMNYRFRNAILGFFGTVDNKGFPDDGQTDQPPSLFARKMDSLREDYPDATYYTLMNLMDSHDTERILWSLTPGQSNREEREFNAANLAKGKQRLRLAGVVQFTVPGAPTVYYGDEVGLTGSDDPDDRRTFPWVGDAPGGDAALRAFYKQLATIRRNNPVLRNGALKFLLTDDANRTMAYGMRADNKLAIIAVNRNETGSQTLTIPLTGYLRNGVTFTDALSTQTATSQNGSLTITLPALGAAILVAGNGQDLTPTSQPTGLTATAGNSQVTLQWTAVAGASSYRVYRSPLSGGGYVYLGSTASTNYTDNAVTNAQVYHYVVTALDNVGNESAWSNDASATPFAPIGWAGHLWPPTLTITINALQSQTVFAQLYVAGVTEPAGQGAGVIGQFAYGPTGSNPATWTWVPMVYNGDTGNNDEYRVTFTPEQVGTFDYLARFSTDLGGHWTYAYTDSSQRGVLNVNPSGDTQAPAAPANLHRVSSSANSVTVGWNTNSEPDLYRYEVWRSNTAGGPYSKIANVPGGTTQYVDQAVTTGATYYYVVTAQDNSFNRSANSNEVSVQAQAQMVAVTFTVTVPAGTPPGGTVYIAGSFTAPYPTWDPGAPTMQLAWVDAQHASITLNILDGTAVEYKYTLGNWEHGEKDAACQEIGNRQLTVVYDPGGAQQVNDTVANWRNVAPCGN